MANQNNLPDLITNPLNPYFVHANESPSQPLVFSTTFWTKLSYMHGLGL